MEYPDNELTFYLQDKETYDDALDLLYEKYKYIIEVLINKYKRVFLALNIDIEEVKQEANLGFSNAIHNYNENKNTTLSTFITLVVERKIRHIIKKYETIKSRVESETISLNGNDVNNLENYIGDETYEPIKRVKNIDTIKYINNEVQSILSIKELEVYNLLKEGYNYQEIASILNKTPKQIDNTIQRIRIKLKNLK